MFKRKEKRFLMFTTKSKYDKTGQRFIYDVCFIDCFWKMASSTQISLDFSPQQSVSMMVFISKQLCKPILLKLPCLQTNNIILVNIFEGIPPKGRNLLNDTFYLLWYPYLAHICFFRPGVDYLSLRCLHPPWRWMISCTRCSWL